jgi:hypothetical protein
MDKRDLATIAALVAFIYFVPTACRPSSHLEPILDDPGAVGWLRGWSKESLFSTKKNFKLRNAGDGEWYVIREGDTQPRRIHNLREIGIYTDDDLSAAADMDRQQNQ